MKKPNTNPIKSLFANALKPPLASVALALLFAGLPPQVSGENLNPGIIPPHAKPYGKSYGEWSALWWQWAFKSPVTGSPLMDATGAAAVTGQSGPVWFLAGMYNSIEVEPGHWLGVAVREFTVPVGKALFFPILNTGADNVGYEPPYTVEELWEMVHANLATATNMACEIDGAPVEGLSNLFTTPYRAESPVFSYWLPPEDNLYQFYGVDFWGTTFPVVSDGVYLMLAPLSRGQHTIHFGGDLMSPANIPYFTLDITCHITVDPHAK